MMTAGQFVGLGFLFCTFVLYGILWDTHIGHLPVIFNP